MSDPGYDDTEMSNEEFETRIGSAIPAGDFADAVFVAPSKNRTSTTSSLVSVHISVPLAHLASRADTPV